MKKHIDLMFSHVHIWFFEPVILSQMTTTNLSYTYCFVTSPTSSPGGTVEVQKMDHIPSIFSGAELDQNSYFWTHLLSCVVLHFTSPPQDSRRGDFSLDISLKRNTNLELMDIHY